MEEKFSMFLPIEIIEKADSKKDKDGLPDQLLIAGVASTPKEGKDVDGQTLMPSGFDFEPLLKSGFLNLEHAYSKTKDASMIVGEPTNAFIKDNDFHIEGMLYKDNPKAVALYKLGQTLKKSGSSRKIGYSIEGVPTSFDPLDKSIIKSAKITGVALTLSPKCKGTQMLIKGGEIEYEKQEGSDYLIDIIDEFGERIRVDSQLNIIKGEISKAMEAGSTTGTDTLDKPSNGAALKMESVNGADPKKKKDYKKLLSALRKRRGDNGNEADVVDLTKAETYSYLIQEHNMDANSCMMFWDLAVKIQKSFQ